MLASRYVTFHKSLIKSNKLGVRFLARLNENDNRTLLGRTLGSLAQECCVNDIGSLAPSLVKKMCPYFSVPELEKWRIPIVKELLSIHEGLLSLENIRKEEISARLSLSWLNYSNGGLPFSSGPPSFCSHNPTL